MGFQKTYAADGMAEFRQRLADNMLRLSRETDGAEFAVPVGLFFVVDEKNGGDVTAREVARRFALLDVESRDVIDFFFLGWRKRKDEAVLEFDLALFEQCRASFREVGIYRFGGNADLFVVDAWWRSGRVQLDFEHAIHVDLSSVAGKAEPNVGGFLQGLIDAAETIRESARGGSPVVRISDKLGLASATRSFIDFILEKWGAVIGAKNLKHLAVQRIGPSVDLADLKL